MDWLKRAFLTSTLTLPTSAHVSLCRRTVIQETIGCWSYDLFTEPTFGDAHHVLGRGGRSQASDRLKENQERGGLLLSLHFWRTLENCHAGFFANALLTHPGLHPPSSLGMSRGGANLGGFVLAAAHRARASYARRCEFVWILKHGWWWAWWGRSLVCCCLLWTFKRCIVEVRAPSHIIRWPQVPLKILSTEVVLRNWRSCSPFILPQLCY